MGIRQTEEFLFLCKLSGFFSPKEVQDYIRNEGIECNRLYDELDAYCFPEYISKGVSSIYVKCL